GILWLAGLFAISGMPPFGTFFSKFMILQEAILQQRLAQTILFLFFLAVIFISMSKTVLFMSQGERCHLEVKTTSLSEFICTVLPPLLLLGWILLLGFYLPDFLRKTITEITMQLQAG
ncbi:MAG: hydrogenase, partial [Candidatus Aureabacteria bacterium]|nr:hydrogenase [Candidatus Auribacterota bacterium]